MWRSRLEGYLDTQLGILLEGEVTILDLHDIYGINDTEARKYIKIGIAKGHIQTVKKVRPKTFELTGGGILCRYWLTLGEKFGQEKIITSKHDLDSKPLKDMVDYQLLESEVFKEACGLKFLCKKILEKEGSFRSRFQQEIDLLRYLYYHASERYNNNVNRIIFECNLTYENFKRLESLSVSKFVKIETHPGTGRYGFEKRYSINTDGASCVKAYNAFFWMFDLSEFLTTQFKLFILGNNQNYPHSRRTLSTSY